MKGADRNAGRKARRTPGRPTAEDSEALRNAIAHAAVKEFVSKGFESGNVASIAADAGVTKATIYRLYGPKESLYKLAIREALKQAHMPVQQLDSRLDLETALARAAGAISRSYANGSVGTLWHSLLAVKHRFPEFHEEITTILRSESNATALAAYFAELHQTGEFDIPNPRRTAHHFALLVGQGRELALETRKSEELEAERVAEIVRMFVKALRRDALTRREETATA